MYKVTEKQVQELTAIIAELPTKFGIPLVNVLNTFEKVIEKVEDKKEPTA